MDVYILVEMKYVCFFSWFDVSSRRCIHSVKTSIDLDLSTFTSCITWLRDI